MGTRTLVLLALTACAATPARLPPRGAEGNEPGLLWVTIVAKGME